jgi:hypothetical protein
LAASAARRHRRVDVELGQRRFVISPDGGCIKLELPGLGAKRIVGREKRIVIRRTRRTM